MHKQRFKVEINDAVINEIQEAVDYYNKKQKSLGNDSTTQLNPHLDHLNTMHFYIRSSIKK